MSETTVRSREEADELQRSTKKVKENHKAGSSNLFSFAGLEGKGGGGVRGLDPTKTNLLAKY